MERKEKEKPIQSAKLDRHVPSILIVNNSPLTGPGGRPNQDLLLFFFCFCFFSFLILSWVCIATAIYYKGSSSTSFLFFFVSFCCCVFLPTVLVFILLFSPCCCLVQSVPRLHNIAEIRSLQPAAQPRAPSQQIGDANLVRRPTTCPSSISRSNLFIHQIEKKEGPWRKETKITN
jgi:hypothetical protein